MHSLTIMVISFIMSDFDPCQLKKIIRSVRDWPRQGITFRDITPLLKLPEWMKMVTKALSAEFTDSGITHIGALEARGFIFGTLVAAYMNLPLIPFRKPGKLPAEHIGEEYALEYGTATIEVHTDALSHGDNILLVDDLIATGGTLSAATALCHRLGAGVHGVTAVIGLPYLQGIKKLEKSGMTVKSLIEFQD